MNSNGNTFELFISPITIFSLPIGAIFLVYLLEQVGCLAYLLEVFV